MRAVQLTVRRADFADRMAAIRDWLDRNGRPLVRFETASEADMIVLTIKFPDDALAIAFRGGFTDHA